jgi:CRP-like cAMP-binding protein
MRGDWARVSRMTNRAAIVIAAVALLFGAAGSLFGAPQAGLAALKRQYWRPAAIPYPKEPIIAKISQETLAEMIGTTRSRVSFFMNKFRELGLIDYNGSIEVHSSLLNLVLHDQPQIKT